MPGQRAPVRAGESPAGAGDTPRFALFTEPDRMPQDLLKSYELLLEPDLCEPHHSGGMWLVRHYGYTALAAKAGDWNAVTAYLGID